MFWNTQGEGHEKKVSPFPLKCAGLNSLPGELYNGFTEAHIPDLLILLHVTRVVE